MFSRIFIERPRLAMVISLVMVFAGILSINKLPVEEYPNITPPQIYIVCTYTGASSEVVRDTVAFPIEDEVNGVDDIMYYSSDSDNRGNYYCLITFKSGTDPDIAMVNVQNAVKRAEPRLPSDVTRTGISISERGNDQLGMVAFMTDGTTMSPMELSNYVSKTVKDYIQRVDGVSSVDIMGAQNYAMRIWLDPMRMSALNVSVSEVMSAVESQNIQAVSGTLGAEGGSDYIQMKIDALGRLRTTEEFGDIVIRTADDGSFIKVKDIGDVELGAEEYTHLAQYDGKQSFALSFYRDSKANAMQTMARVKEVLEDLKQRLPAGVTFELAYDPTEFIGVTMREIVVTLVSALLLVVIITYLFLQDWRATIIPSLAIPVSLMATFPVMLMIGFSVNVLTMFGLILVIGSLVDDAIVVVEGTMALMEREQLSPKEAAIKCMKQITGAIIATTLVTVACYVPLAFYGGMVGTIYMQFAVTMCVSLCFSTVVAMTLSPALCALILRKPPEHPPVIFAPVNFIINGSRKIYLAMVWFLVRRGVLTLALLAAVFGGIWFFSTLIDSSFLPEEDKGVILCNIELPPSASLERTIDTVGKFRDEVQKLEGVDHTLSVAGFGFLSGSAENAGMLILDLKHWDERKDKSLSAHSLLQKVQKIAEKSLDGRIVCFMPPAIMGLGATGGISMYLCGEGDISNQELDEVTQKFCRDISSDPDALYAMSTFNAKTPQIYLEIDREKAMQMGLPVESIFFALQSQMASYYINDFNILGESFYVKMQAGKDVRATEEDIMRLQITSSTGESVPLSAVAELRYSTGAHKMSRFNKMTAASVSAQTKPGVPSVTLMDKILELDLPSNYHVEWTDLSYHENQNRGKIGGLMALAVLFAYLFLVGQYESWTIPVPVMLTVATACLGALVGLWITGETLSIYAQLGLVMLIGLTAKNAILMVEFSKQERDHGVDINEAALNGASLRYRAVLMTAWSFLFGVLPLVFATGAGAGSRVAIGVPTFSGMLVATFVGIILTPALYSVFQKLRERIKHLFHMKTAAEKYAEAHRGEITAE